MRQRPKASRRRRGRAIGLLGGSFNPAHDGHRHVSEEALKRLRLDEVWWLVSPQNPLKPAAGMVSLDRRLAAARRLLGSRRGRRIRVTGVEAEFGTTYTADTLARLRRRYPRTRFVWLMGADNLVQIPQWRDWHEIFMFVPIAVFTRPSYDSRALTGKAAQRFRRNRIPSRAAGTLAHRTPPVWTFLAIRRHPASATAIRNRLDAAGNGRGGETGETEDTDPTPSAAEG